MYRVSPFTYLIDTILSIAVANAPVHCSSIEFLNFDPVNGTTCGSYMQSYMQMAGGYLTNSEAMAKCEFCPLSDTNQFLKLLSIDYVDRWRNIGILFVYVVFNAVAAVGLYWLVRVPKKGKKTRVKESEVVDLKHDDAIEGGENGDGKEEGRGKESVVGCKDLET